MGTGGQGDVFLAEQKGPLHKKVGLKVIRVGTDQEILARFEYERAILARMNHPYVAQVLDAGSTDDGRPYFVMEYIDGEPITAFCDRYTLDLPARLQLFNKVCEGVQHAHQNGIIHRDIKPSNILVTLGEGGPSPKVIDFGIARAIGQTFLSRSGHTRTGLVLGTPAYMSPEQARWDQRAIDTRSDVYSLGVLLYELLVGTVPFDPKEYDEKPLDEFLRLIREKQPQRPSTRLLMSAEVVARVPVVRPLLTAPVVSALRKDLDWVVLCALEKSPDRRYQSVHEMGADIRRFLDGQPLIARPPSTLYQLRKIVARHKIPFGLAAGAGVLLIATTVIVSMQARRIAHEKVRADREARTASTVTDLFSDLFRGVDPIETRGLLPFTRGILQRGIQRIIPGLRDEPLVRARLMEATGRVYVTLGMFETAEALLTQALDARRRELGERSPEVADSLDSLGRLDMEMDHPEKALEEYEEALTLRKGLFTPDDPHIASSLNNVGIALRELKRLKESKSALEQALAIRLSRLPSDDVQIAESHLNLAELLSDMDDGRAALDHYEKARGIYDRKDPENPDRAYVLDSLGVEKAKDRHFKDALTLHQEALAIRERVLGPNHPDVAISLINSGNDLLELHEYQEARARLERAIRIYDSLKKIGRRNLAFAHGSLAALFVEIRECEASQRHLEEVRKILTDLDGADSEDLADILEDISGRLRKVGRSTRAIKIENEAKQIRAWIAEHHSRG